MTVGALLCGVVATTGFTNPPSSQASRANTACEARQTITIDLAISWDCEIRLAPPAAYLIRVDQRNADVMILVTSPAKREVLAVDTPTKRAGPELALVQPEMAGTYVVSVRAVDNVAQIRRVDFGISKVERADKAPLVNGLRALTRAASRQDKPTPEAGASAIAALREALGQFGAASAPEFEAEVLLRIAATNYWIVNDWSAAGVAAQQAMGAFSRMDDAVMHSQAAIIRAAALLEISTALKSPGRRSSAAAVPTPLEEAIQLLDAAAGVSERARFAYAQAQALNFHGLCLYYQGEYSTARRKYLQSAKLFDELGDRISEALPLQNIALIDYENGDYAKAIDSYGRLLGVLDPSRDASQYATVVINRGTAQYGVGDFAGALESFVQGLEICESRGFTAEQARSLHSLGMVYLVIGERERAEIFLERALALRRPLAAQSPRGLQTSLIRVGDLKREDGNVRTALQLHLEALDHALSPSQRARALYAIGRDHEANGAIASARQAYDSALKLDLPDEFPVRLLVLGAFGRTQLAAGDESGRELIERAALLHEKHGDYDLAAQDLLALASADQRDGRLSAALSKVQKALSLYETLRFRAINPDLRATYLASRSAAFELQGDLFMAMWEQATQPAEKRRLSDRALVANEANRRRALEDFRSLAASGDQSGSSALDARIAAKRHRLAVLMEQRNPSAEKIEVLRRDIGMLRTQLDLAQEAPSAATARSDQRGAPPRTVREIQALLSPDDVLLAYQLGERRSWLWAITRETTTATQLRGRAEIESAVRELYAAWSTPNAQRMDSELAASRIVLGDGSVVRGKRTLTVMAEGPLRSIPFGALLIDGAPGKAPVRVATAHAVRVRSTLSGESADGRSAESRTRPDNRILLVGDPTAPVATGNARPELAADPWAMQPLPGTRREVLAIAQIAAPWRSYVLLGAQATKPALLSMPLDSFRAIHFATHARLDVQDPQLSSIALSSREANFAASNSILTVREILGFRLEAETVVLSACEASLGKSYRGQFSFGLSEAFLLAGARNVLGSLWRVSDDAAQEYMRRFYEEYIRHDAPPEAAAQAAARGMAANPQFGHPYFWAAFVVTQR